MHGSAAQAGHLDTNKAIIITHTHIEAIPLQHTPTRTKKCHQWTHTHTHTYTHRSHAITKHIYTHTRHAIPRPIHTIPNHSSLSH